MEPNADPSYFKQSDFLDGSFEFHRDWFDPLSEDRLADLDKYYGIRESPSDLILWRAVHSRADPSLPARARNTFARVLRDNGMTDATVQSLGL